MPEKQGPLPPVGPILVPMDSWVYAVLARLAGLGYIPDQTAGTRPWSREECIRQINEAEDIQSRRLALAGSGELQEVSRLITALRKEFSTDHDYTSFLELESVYTRYQEIRGKPLVDGYNFGQTTINDYGRRISEGSNVISGVTAQAVSGRFSFYLRGEYQHSGMVDDLAARLRPEVDQLQPVLQSAGAGSNSFRPLEMYAGAQFGSWSLTLGKQELWWGPGESGPLSFSANAEPFYFFRFTNSTPYRLPGALRRLGTFRADFMVGKLSGHQAPPRPLINGQKLTWNLPFGFELGFTRWSLFDGAGAHGFTAGSVLRNLFANGATYGSATDPGDRKSGFDFRWHLPGIARWITIFSDFYADDEPTPLTSLRRSAFSPGLYLAALPGLKNWDLRIESPSTRVGGDDQGGHFLYWNNVYQDANTNQGNLLGSWVGRDGRGLFLQSRCWLKADSGLEFTYRQNRIGPAYLPGGGTQNNGSIKYSIRLRREMSLSVAAQYERYYIPVLGGPKHDLLLSIQTTYQPKLKPVHN